MAPDNENRTTYPRKAEVEMAGPFSSQEPEEDVTFDEVAGMADRLGLEGEQRANYIDDHMKQLGYDPVQSRESYVRRQEEGTQQEEPSRWGFGGGRGSQGQRQQAGGQQSRPQDDDRFGR